MNTDDKWMRQTLALAKKGRGEVHPNPMVGALVVRQGRVVGRGFHRQFGQAHAEVDALKSAGKRAAGGTLYVNLEPCSHWGKTPPCVSAIVAAGITRVVAAMRDPNPLVSGRGFSTLKRQGIRVTKGVLRSEAEDLNKAFITWILKKRPYVTLKIASSLDGRTATLTGDSKWITGPLARQAGYAIRAEVDAIAVGLKTILADDPSLTAHGLGNDPIRIIFDSRLRSPLSARVFKPGAATWCLATDHTVLRHMDRFKRQGVQVILCHADAERRVSIPQALSRLAKRGIAHLLVEGGSTLQKSFLKAGVVDEVLLFMAPTIIGDAKTLRGATHFGMGPAVRIGEDFFMRGRVRRSKARKS